MKPVQLYSYTVYSHNLTEASRSFASDITIEDFKRNVWKEITKAELITYINPRGQSIVLKSKYGVKTS